MVQQQIVRIPLSHEGARQILFVSFFRNQEIEFGKKTSANGEGG